MFFVVQIEESKENVVIREFTSYMEAHEWIINNRIFYPDAILVILEDK